MAMHAHRLSAAVLVHRRRHGEAIELLDRTLLSPHRAAALRHSDPNSLRSAWYLRAKACDRESRFDDAFESAQHGNELAQAEFDPVAYEDAIGALMSHWTRDAMRDFPQSRIESELAVFIAGMPRSGTSLLDQVIDAHGEAAGVGEMATIEQFARDLEQVWDATLPAPESFGPMRDRAFKQAASGYLRQCQKHAPGARRVVNKALGNNRILGLLARLFPRTRIVHALRDPRDVAISCFMGGFNSAFYPWTSRLDWTAVAWAQSRRLLEHWQRETDLPILEVRYEALVADPASQLPRVIGFLGLPWDAGCTRFHESRRVVRTLSYDQVNRPLYTTSIARWRNYEKHLKRIEWPAYEP